MKLISEQIVKQTWMEISSYDTEKIDFEFSKFGERQPDLTYFIMEFTQDQQQTTIELCLYMFFTICRIFEKSSANRIKQITFDEIETIFKKNENLIENLEGVHERFYERIARVQFFNQPFVMKYILETLVEETEIENTLSEKETGYLFFIFKNVVDIFDEAFQQMDLNERKKIK
ncbi:MAG: hypothetical protein C0403_02410 [Desulfobacterium sp.]|nr:hypothetical protein [Desulfobacterium sp.]